MENGYHMKLSQSLLASDSNILIFAVLIGCVLAGVLAFAAAVRAELEQKRSPLSRFKYWGLRILYEVFLTAITIFPLLGLYGTVRALLSLDLADMESTQLRFFDALTSTAWGIIFAVVFKIINAVIAQPLEEIAGRAARRLHPPKPKKPEDAP